MGEGKEGFKMTPLEEAHRVSLLLTEEEAAIYLPWLIEALQHPDPTQVHLLLSNARIKLLEAVDTYSRWSVLARATLPEDTWLTVPARFVLWAEESDPESVPLAEDDVSELRICRALREFWENNSG